MVSPKGILFDLDGTLIDSLQVTFDAFNAGITLCGMQALPPRELMAHFGPGEFEILQKIVGPTGADAANQAFRDHLQANMGKVPLHSGVAELLDQLRGYKLGIVTGRGWHTTELILRHHGILERFEIVVSNDHVSSPKPSPEGVLKALSKLALPADEVLFVGDSEVDMMAARLARVHGVAATWDWLADRRKLERQSPRFWAATPADVLALCSAR